MAKLDSNQDSRETLIQAKIQRLALFLLGNYHDACDLAQEVFLELEKGRQKWEKADSQWAWAMGVFHHQFQRFLRLKQKWKSTPLAEDAEPASKEIAPEHAAMVKDELEKTLANIRRLDQDIAEALLLFSVEKMSIKEIAKLQNVAEGTVKWRIFEARRRLAQASGEGKI